MHGQDIQPAFLVSQVKLALEDVQHRLRSGVGPQTCHAVHIEIDRVVAEDDRTYLTRTVAGQAGIEPAEVERRIAAVFAQAKAALDRTRAAAESARRFSILIAFLTAASLAVAAAAAWWGASLGGKHRDENTDFSKLMHW